jgi:pimeloyl-ACP methyl ester carboxylesterase
VREFAGKTLSHSVPPTFFEIIVRENLKVPARVWKATFKGLLEDDSFRELQKISVPTLIVWGDRDAFLPRSDQESLSTAIASSRLVVYPGAGHAVYWEAPDRVASDLVTFVEQLATTKSGRR